MYLFQNKHLVGILKAKMYNVQDDQPSKIVTHWVGVNCKNIKLQRKSSDKLR
jgi:hypothetical protein